MNAVRRSTDYGICLPRNFTRNMYINGKHSIQIHSLMNLAAAVSFLAISVHSFFQKIYLEAEQEMKIPEGIHDS